MSESEFETPPIGIAPADGEAPPPAPADTRHDEDDRLKPEFVSEVVARLAAGNVEGVRALVEPMHAADIADLFELVGRDERQALATALSGLWDGDVLS
jgi:magnesium transporter